MKRSTQKQRLTNFVRLSALGLLTLGMLTTSDTAQADDQANFERTLTVACELEDASEVMRDELKIHFRGVRGYGVMLATAAQIKGRSAAIGRRFDRNPYYRGLDRDVARVEDLAIRMGELVQKAVDCPDRLERASGDIRHIIGQANRLLDLTEALRRLVTSYCANEVVAIEETTYQPLGYREPYSGYGVYGYDRDLEYDCPFNRRLRSQMRTPRPNRSSLPRIQNGPTLQAPYSNNPFEPGMQPTPNFEIAPGIPTTQRGTPGASITPSILATPQLIGPEPQLIAPQRSNGQPVLPYENPPAINPPAPSMKSVLGGR